MSSAFLQEYNEVRTFSDFLEFYERNRSNLNQNQQLFITSKLNQLYTAEKESLSPQREAIANGIYA